MSANLLPSIARSSRIALVRPARVAQQYRSQSTSGPTPSTTGSSSGPAAAEQRPQGSDKRGTTTSYALPAVAASLVLIAVAVRLSSRDTKQSAINVGVNTDGADKLASSSKIKGVESVAKANAEKQ